MKTGMRSNLREKKESCYTHSICTKTKCKYRTEVGCKKLPRKYFTASERASIVDGFCVIE